MVDEIAYIISHFPQTKPHVAGRTSWGKLVHWVFRETET